MIKGSQSSCKYNTGSNVIYGGSQYLIVDRKNGVNAKIGERTFAEGQESNDLIDFVKTGLSKFGKTFDIEGDFSTKQKNDYKAFLFSRAIEIIRPACVGYILLSDPASASEEKKKAAKNASYNYAKNLPAKIGSFDVNLVKVTDESLISDAGPSASSAEAEASLPELVPIKAEIERLGSIFKTPAANAEVAGLNKPPEVDPNVQQLIDITGLSEEEAKGYLEAAGGKVDVAFELFNPEGQPEVGRKTRKNKGAKKSTRRKKNRS